VSSRRPGWQAASKTQGAAYIIIITLMVLAAAGAIAASIQVFSESTSSHVTASVALESTVTGYASHNLTSSELHEITLAGGTFVRTDFPMRSVQFNSSQSFDWGPLDKKVAAATGQGLRVLGILDYSPQWNAHPDCTVGSPDQCAPADPNAFANYAAAAAAHFPQVTHWEIWNEPNLKQFWSPSPSSIDYVTTLNGAYAAIKAVAPDDVVIAGALSRASDVPGVQIAPTTFVNSMYANRAKFDILSLHPYTYPFSPDTANSGNGWLDVATIRATMVANGDAAKKIWITELGVPTCGPGNASAVDAQPFSGDDYMTEAAQETILSAVMTKIRSVSYIGAFFVYEIKDDNSGDRSNRENCFGIFHSDGSPKPVFSTIKK
jgi:polysaccharide biosynthesis protein PslG